MHAPMMMSIRTSFCLALLLAATVLPAAGDAQNRTGGSPASARTIGVTLSYSDHAFDERLDATTTYPMAAVSASFGSGAASIELNFGQSLGSRDVSERDATGDGERSDIAVSVDYRFGASFSLFGGYRDSETSIDFRPRDGAAGDTESYATDGYHIGLGYLWQLPQLGAIRISYAWTRLDGDLEFIDRNAPVERADTALGLTGRFSPDANGTLARLDWTVALAGGLALRTRIELRDTTFELRDEAGRFDLDQDETLIELGVLVPF